MRYYCLYKRCQVFLFEIVILFFIYNYINKRNVKYKNLLIMNNVKKSWQLLFCLIAEVAILLVGLEFFNPFPIEEHSQGGYMFIMTRCICLFSLVIGIVAISLRGIGQKDKGVFSMFNGGLIVVSILLTLFIGSLWPIFDVIIIVMITVFIILEIKKSS